jgi:hypothetical protein
MGSSRPWTSTSRGVSAEEDAGLIKKAKIRKREQSNRGYFCRLGMIM